MMLRCSMLPRDRGLSLYAELFPFGSVFFATLAAMMEFLFGNFCMREGVLSLIH